MLYKTLMTKSSLMGNLYHKKYTSDLSHSILLTYLGAIYAIRFEHWQQNNHSKCCNITLMNHFYRTNNNIHADVLQSSHCLDINPGSKNKMPVVLHSMHNLVVLRLDIYNHTILLISWKRVHVSFLLCLTYAVLYFLCFFSKIVLQKYHSYTYCLTVDTFFESKNYSKHFSCTASIFIIPKRPIIKPHKAIYLYVTQSIILLNHGVQNHAVP